MQEVMIIVVFIALSITLAITWGSQKKENKEQDQKSSKGGTDKRDVN